VRALAAYPIHELFFVPRTHCGIWRVATSPTSAMAPNFSRLKPPLSNLGFEERRRPREYIFLARRNGLELFLWCLCPFFDLLRFFIDTLPVCGFRNPIVASAGFRDLPEDFFFALRAEERRREAFLAFRLFDFFERFLNLCGLLTFTRNVRIIKFLYNPLVNNPLAFHLIRAARQVKQF